MLKVSAVEPDVRVVMRDTLSLGEDRTVLASTADVTIKRAGIFKLSFVIPPSFDVGSISGASLSQWTELKTDAGHRHHAEPCRQNEASSNSSSAFPARA